MNGMHITQFDHACLDLLSAIHSTKIPTGPTGKSGPRQKEDQFFRNFSGWTEPIHWVLDQNFRKFWWNGSRPLSLVIWSCMFWNLRKTMQCSKSIKKIPDRRLQSLSPALYNLWILQVQYFKLVLIHASPVSYRSIKGGYYCLPSMPWAYLGVIVSSLCDENMNFTFISSGEIFTALRMRFGGKVNLSVISHLSLGGQNDSLIKLSCFL